MQQICCLNVRVNTSRSTAMPRRLHTQMSRLTFFRLRVSVSAVESRRRVLDDGRRQGHRQSMAHLQPGAALRLPGVRQQRSLACSLARPKVSAVNLNLILAILNLYM
jgi:hypothetical protein